MGLTSHARFGPVRAAMMWPCSEKARTLLRARLLDPRRAQPPPSAVPARQPDGDRGDRRRRLLRAAPGGDRRVRARHARACAGRRPPRRGRGPHRRRVDRRQDRHPPPRRRRPGPGRDRLRRAREDLVAQWPRALLRRARAHRPALRPGRRRADACSIRVEPMRSSPTPIARRTATSVPRASCSRRTRRSAPRTTRRSCSRSTSA